MKCDRQGKPCGSCVPMIPTMFLAASALTIFDLLGLLPTREGDESEGGGRERERSRQKRRRMEGRGGGGGRREKQAKKLTRRKEEREEGDALYISREASQRLSPASNSELSPSPPSRPFRALSVQFDAERKPLSLVCFCFCSCFCFCFCSRRRDYPATAVNTVGDGDRRSGPTPPRRPRPMAALPGRPPRRLFRATRSRGLPDPPQSKPTRFVIQRTAVPNRPGLATSARPSSSHSGPALSKAVRTSGQLVNSPDTVGCLNSVNGQRPRARSRYQQPSHIAGPAAACTRPLPSCPLRRQGCF